MRLSPRMMDRIRRHFRRPPGPPYDPETAARFLELLRDPSLSWGAVLRRSGVRKAATLSAWMWDSPEFADALGAVLEANLDSFKARSLPAGARLDDPA